LIGSTISHYQILERLGGGGMGVVYKARDVKLDRLVALKFLASQRGAPEEQKRRFLREAQAASQLDHPNICTIHEVDETEDGALFIAMALYEGETLRDRLDRGALAVDEAVEIASQVAAGLARAHERGIVHRDVKPANLVLTADGQVKILDFGIARLADQSRLTRAGTTLGTAAYMSPEQFHGEPGDPRTDVWSLGVVIYEMVTGRLPFADLDEREMVRAILQSPPRPMAPPRPGVNEGLERIVIRALAKPPAGRYASMESMRTDLRKLGALVASAASAMSERSEAEDESDRTLLEIPLASGSARTDIRTDNRTDNRTETGELDEGLLGRVVGHYRILELLGGGGMGVVYKAEDTRLSRVVALKFLPPELTRDAEAKERFMQEARTASSLDHPNLCTILELGETRSGRLYLAMPCYDGETLRRKIAGGPLPVDEAAEIAEQIARGLAKAHRNGIVHRDVKPANVIVTSDGVVKILDFGLAKLAGSAVITSTGSSAGTPAYMSPEQARGEEVDHRTDVWSLGVVLYEMLAGRRPFRGDHEQAVIHSLLNDRPQPLREVRSGVAPRLERIVDGLLAKDPAGRYASAEEAFADLRAFRGETATTTMLTQRPSRRGVRPWVWGVAALAAAALTAVGVALWRPAERPETVSGQVAHLTLQPGIETFPSLAPDGDFFVYVKATTPGNLDIYLQRVGGGNPMNLTEDSPVDDTQPAYSPDGRQIAFRSERGGGGIFLMGATGESARRVTEFGYNPAWSPDGREFAVSTSGVSDPRIRPSRGSLWRVDMTTGRRKLVAQPDAVQPSWSPHGSRIAYWSAVEGKRVLYTVPAHGGEAVQVTDDSFLNWDPVWSRDGRHLYFASDRGGTMNLWRVPIDEGSGRLLGKPEPVPTPSQSSGLLSFSRDERRILYASNDSTSSLERAAFDPSMGRVAGPLLPVNRELKTVNSAETSPDGQWIVFDASVPNEDLFLIRVDGSGLRRLTEDVHKDRNPRWSPAGDRILFYSNRGGLYQAWTIRPDGSQLEKLTDVAGGVANCFWATDGRRLVCPSSEGASVVDLTRPLRERIPRLLRPPPDKAAIFIPSSWTRDGSRLAGGLIPPGKAQEPGIVTYSFESGSYDRLTDRGEGAIWLPDGQRLLYQAARGVLLLDPRTGETKKILETAADSWVGRLSLSPDGRFLTVVRVLEEGDVWMLERTDR